MTIALDILIVGTATAAGFATGWLIRGEKRSRSREDSAKWREEAIQYKEQVLAAMNDAASARNQAALSKSEAATFKLEAAQAKRELEDARDESARAHEALSQLQSLANRIAADVGQHSSRVQAINAELEQDKAEAASVVAAVAQLLEANAKMHEQLESAEEKLKHQAEQLQAQIAEARTDALTGLLNRRAFDGELAELKQQQESSGQPSSIMMLDVDHFKKFNDTFGHLAGDEVLRGVARVLQRSVPPSVIVCRYGGEEFALIFPNMNLEACRPIGEHARSAVADTPFEFEGTVLRVTASGGMAEFCQGEKPAHLVKRADDALYVCKEAGRNCGYYHDGTEILPLAVQMPNVPEFDESWMDNPNILSALSTRESLIEDLERRLAEWRRGGAPITMILVEIDKLDRLQTAFGASAGERILKATAQFLKASMRDMDHVARWDERRFALLLPNAAREDACGVAERLRHAIDQCKLPVDNGVLQFTISVGISTVAKNDTTETVIERLDQLVQDASEQGGNRSLIAEPEELEAVS